MPGNRADAAENLAFSSAKLSGLSIFHHLKNSAGIQQMIASLEIG